MREPRRAMAGAGELTLFAVVWVLDRLALGVARLAGAVSDVADLAAKGQARLAARRRTR